MEKERIKMSVRDVTMITKYLVLLWELKIEGLARIISAEIQIVKDISVDES